MRKVSLWLRVRVEGKQRYLPAVAQKHFVALVDGKPQKFEAGSYHLRYEVDGRRIWERVDGTVFKAASKRKIREGELELDQVAPAPKTPTRVTLAEQRNKFLEMKRLTKKQDGTRLDKETLSAYEQQVTEFLALAAKKTYADQIDGMDLRRYMTALEEKGKSHRTICNNYQSVATFLGFCGIDHKKLLPKGERPRPHDADPEAYTLEEMLKFLPAVNRYRDRLFFEFLLKTGSREREATNARWTDLVGGDEPVFKIQNHDETKFRTKTGKSRVVPLERGMYDKLMMWREQNPKTKLIFGTSGDKPDTHFLEVCKEVARRAELNCGTCRGCLGKRKECEKWYLHRFRDSFGTWSVRAGVDIRTVQGWMGHASIQQTEKYVEKGKGAYAQRGINNAFGIRLDLEVAEGAAVM
jgi:integrase